MGNSRSGWYGKRGGRETTARCLRITIAGLLGWQRQGVGMRQIDPGCWLLRINAAEHAVMITTTVHRPAGVRRWFSCPTCLARRATLYYRHDRFACRQCHHLTYESQRESRGLRALRKSLWASRPA